MVIKNVSKFSGLIQSVVINLQLLKFWRLNSGKKKNFSCTRASPPSYLHSCTHVCLKTEQLISSRLCTNHKARCYRTFPNCAPYAAFCKAAPETRHWGPSHCWEDARRHLGDPALWSFSAARPHDPQRADYQTQQRSNNNQGVFWVIKIHLPFSIYLSI